MKCHVVKKNHIPRAHVIHFSVNVSGCIDLS